ncbi:hypothetical protein DSLASN_26670 [Desulfoluna limicola]|uniref:Uncharacterized protein n=1 Tax=Desulfoluna limicola TaxID=2810562 RepID=A0ABN6F5W2_9BACT|nr:hypothetical protein DSLASN_26670 [Desulfoluna limicola]
MRLFDFWHAGGLWCVVGFSGVGNFKTLVNSGDQPVLYVNFLFWEGVAFFYPTLLVRRVGGEFRGNLVCVNMFYGAEYCFLRRY